MVKCITKDIQAELGIFTHIFAYSGIIGIFKNYSGIFRHIQNPV